MNDDAQRPPRRAAAETPHRPGEEVPDHRTKRLPVDSYQRGTFARWCGHRDRVNAWRDRPRAVPT